MPTRSPRPSPTFRAATLFLAAAGAAAVACGPAAPADENAPFLPFSWSEIGPVHTPAPTITGWAVGPPQPTPRPEVLRALSGRRVDARGFVVGLEANSRGLKRFILIRHRAPCCFGRGPLPSAWIDVTLPAGKEVPFDPYKPVEVRGTLRAVEAPRGGTFLAMDAVDAWPLERID